MNPDPRSPHGLDIKKFRDTVVYFRKPIATNSGDEKQPRFPSEDENTWDAVMGFPLLTATAEMLSNQPIPNGTTVVLPIGKLVCKWALRIESKLSED